MSSRRRGFALASSFAFAVDECASTLLGHQTPDCPLVMPCAAEWERVCVTSRHGSTLSLAGKYRAFMAWNHDEAQVCEFFACAKDAGGDAFWNQNSCILAVWSQENWVFIGLNTGAVTQCSLKQNG